MPSLISSLVALSRKTFRRCPATKSFLLSADEFHAKRDELRKLLQRVSVEDVGLDKSVFLQGDNILKSDSDGVKRRKYRASSSYSLCYISIFEDVDVTVGVFLIRPGKSIPLHNHPGMHGFLKCLAGTIDLSAYSELDPDQAADVDCPPYFTEGQRLLAAEGDIFPVKKTTIRGVTSKSPPCILTPTENNYHEVVASSSTPVAFLDILAPPYSSEDTTLDVEDIRVCNYYSEILPPSGLSSSNSNSSSGSMEDEEQAKQNYPDITESADSVWLGEVPPPEDYDMTSEPYLGPRIS